MLSAASQHDEAIVLKIAYGKTALGAFAFEMCSRTSPGAS